MVHYDDPPEVIWIAHLLWLQAGVPAGGPREFLQQAQGIAIGLFKAPKLAKPLVWSCDCGACGEIVGAVDAAARQLVPIEEEHTGDRHRLAIHNESFS